MQIEDFIARVATEPERIVVQNVRVRTPHLRDITEKPGGVLMTDYLALPYKVEQCTTRYRHILGDPVSQGYIDAWRDRQASRLPLPTDLQKLLMHHNGVHLWADVATGRSYTGLAPLDEWELARNKLSCLTELDNFLVDHYWALTYHEEGAAFAVLNIRSGEYFLMDSAGPDETSPIGNNVGELLDWLWETRIPPEPSEFT